MVGTLLSTSVGFGLIILMSNRKNDIDTQTRCKCAHLIFLAIDSNQATAAKNKLPFIGESNIVNERVGRHDMQIMQMCKCDGNLSSKRQ